MKLSLLQLDELAKRAGYENYNALLYELYVVQRMGKDKIAEQLNINVARVRRHVLLFKFPPRGHGGQYESNTKVHLTPELLREIAKDGVPCVAKRLGINPIKLYTGLRGATLPEGF